MWAGATLWLVLVGCPGNGLDTGEDPVIDDGVDPAISVDPPQVGIDGRAQLSGTVADPDQPRVTLVVTLQSDLEGAFWRGNAHPDGHWEWEGELTPGEHQVDATVVDSRGNTDVASVALTVRGVNHEPTCLIAEPEDGSTYAHGEFVHFRAEADDQDGDALTLLWESDLSGPLFMGDEFELILRDGLHQITLEASDPYGGRCGDLIAIEVGTTSDPE